jgi:hypothetical protein
LPLAALEVSVVVPPAQKESVPLMSGAATAVWVTAKPLEADEQLLALVTLTE